MDDRPDPDKLLRRVSEEEARARRGRLHLFLGAAPGVGKTFSMLEAARARHSEGLDVVAGWVVTHGRAETQALLDGLPALHPRRLSYRGVALEEFDLDGALERRPALLLVDELAHSNAPGSRHAKRWQDVRELLEAGIDVYSTLNVQHIESLNDVVAQITGVTVRERVPDSVFAEADEVEVVDLPPDELLQRLREGKVYLPEEAERAREHFFRPGNLIALRELALRKTAERVDVQMQRYREQHAVQGTWPAGERVLVCVAASPYGQRLVRSARQLAAQLRCEWIALYVETPDHARLTLPDREQLHRTLRLAEQLGAETVTISGERLAEEVVHYARSRNVTKLVLGKPPARRSFFRPSFVGEVLRKSSGIDVHVIGDTAEDRLARMRKPTRPRGGARPYLYSAAVMALCGFLCGALHLVMGPVNLAMVFLLGVVLVATRWGRGPSTLASVLAVALFDFFFVPPYLTFAVHDTGFLVTFTVLLLVALVVSNLASRVRMQAEVARERERQTTALYRLAQELARERDVEGVAGAAARHLLEQYGSAASLYLPDDRGGLARALSVGEGSGDANGDQVARWVFEHGHPAGLGTDTLPGNTALYLPLDASGGRMGVLAVRASGLPADMELRHQLETVAGQTALALERALFADRARRSQMEAESERMRSALLSSVSHDLRTPLATIVGVSSALLQGPVEEGERQELTQSIFDESERLSRYVNNLLDMTRLEAGTLKLDRQWQPLEEVIGSALARVRAALAGRAVHLDLPESLPLVSVDSRLLEQLFVNLLENAARHTPPGTPVDLVASAADGIVTVRVNDRGPGLAPGSEEKVFDKFYRGSARTEGAGLGLAICQAIAAAHGGSLRAENRPGGGASFVLALSAQGAPAQKEPPP